MHLQLRRESRLTSPAFCSVSTVSKGVEGTGKCCLGFYHWPKGDWNICQFYGESLENHGWNGWNYRILQGYFLGFSLSNHQRWQAGKFRKTKWRCHGKTSQHLFLPAMFDHRPICKEYGQKPQHRWNWVMIMRYSDGTMIAVWSSTWKKHQNSWQMEVNPTKIWYHILIGYLLYICIYLIESRKQKWDADRYVYIHTHMYVFKYMYICIYIYGGIPYVSDYMHVPSAVV